MSRFVDKIDVQPTSRHTKLASASHNIGYLRYRPHTREPVVVDVGRGRGRGVQVHIDIKQLSVGQAYLLHGRVDVVYGLK